MKYHYHVSHLKCTVSKRFVDDKIKASRNFSTAFIEGSANLRTSSFRDHAKNNMHKQAMQLLKKEQSSDVCDYALITRVFYRMRKQKRKVRKKFDVVYVKLLLVNGSS